MTFTKSHFRLLLSVSLAFVFAFVSALPLDEEDLFKSPVGHNTTNGTHEIHPETLVEDETAQNATEVRKGKLGDLHDHDLHDLEVRKQEEEINNNNREINNNSSSSAEHLQHSFGEATLTAEEDENPSDTTAADDFDDLDADKKTINEDADALRDHSIQPTTASVSGPSEEDFKDFKEIGGGEGGHLKSDDDIDAHLHLLHESTSTTSTSAPPIEAVRESEDIPHNFTLSSSSTSSESSHEDALSRAPFESHSSSDDVSSKNGSDTTTSQKTSVKDDEEEAVDVESWWKNLNLTEEDEADIKEPKPSFLRMVPNKKLIKFRVEDESEWRPYVEEMATFLEPYEKQQNNIRCDFDRAHDSQSACQFDLLSVGPTCTKESNFGYSVGKPCIFLEPDYLKNWTPLPYDNDSQDAPDEIRRLSRIFNANFVFVTCDAGNSSKNDESNRVQLGPIAYLPPYQGFPNYYFPVDPEKKNYVAPLLALEFLNPANGTTLQVVCTAWSKNIDLNTIQRNAYTKFYIHIH